VDESTLHEMLDRAVASEPPLGPMVDNAVRAGIRVRRRRMVLGAAGCVAAAAVIGGMIPVLNHVLAVRPAPVVAHTSTPSPSPIGSGFGATPSPGPGHGNKHGDAKASGAAPKTSHRPGTAPGAPGLYVVGADSSGAYLARVNGVRDQVSQVDPIGGSAAAIAVTPDHRTAYVLKEDSVQPVFIGTGSAGPRITVGNMPVAMAMTPDGRTLYVVNQGSDTVTPIATATNRAGHAIPVGQYPSAIAVTPDGTTAYVLNSKSNSVTPIRTADDAPGPAIPVGEFPLAITITPDGKTVYVANYFGRSVTPISTASDRAGDPIGVSGQPSAITVSPSGTSVYVYNRPSVMHIDVATNTVLPELIGLSGRGVGDGWIAVSPDGKTVYAPAITGVVPISTANDKAGNVIAVGAGASAIAFAADGRTAYVCSGWGNGPGPGVVTPVDVQTNQPGKPIRLNGPCDAMVVIP
jgi:YVTN family beta-propeller protein